MLEFLRDEEEERPFTAEKQSSPPHFSNAVEAERWYGEQLSIADTEIRILKQGEPSSRRSLIWQHLQNKWKSELSNLKEQLAKEILKYEGELLNDILGFEDTLRIKTEEWKYRPENWGKLSSCRRELQALQKCEGMMQEAVLEIPA